MSKFCPMCNTVTNCTDNCKHCLEEENENAWNEAVDFGGVHTMPYEQEEMKCQRNFQSNQSEPKR